MISTRLSALALACGLLVTPLAIAAANPETPAKPEATATSAEGAETADQTPVEAAAEDKRICRYIKPDMSSRRKTKVCRTVEEWRELNNIR